MKSATKGVLSRLESTKIVFVLSRGLAPGPAWGAHDASLDPLAARDIPSPVPILTQSMFAASQYRRLSSKSPAPNPAASAVCRPHHICRHCVHHCQLPQLVVICGQQPKAIWTFRVQGLSHMVHVPSQFQAPCVGMHYRHP